MREHQPDSDMPLIQLADLSPHRLKRFREIYHMAQCGQREDFTSLLSFTVWMLHFVDYKTDGLVIDRVAENAICQSVGYDEFQRILNETIFNLKSTPPYFLSLPQTYTTAIKIFDGWIDTPKTSCNLRSTLVWETDDRLVAIHTRFQV